MNLKDNYTNVKLPGSELRCDILIIGIAVIHLTNKYTTFKKDKHIIKKRMHTSAIWEGCKLAIQRILERLLHLVSALECTGKV